MATIKIRQARPLDAANLVRVLIEAHGEASAYPPVDEVLGLRWVTQTLIEGYVMVADVSGRLVGTLALTNFQYPWSPQWFLNYEWLFVQKKFRKAGAFDALVKAAHAYADSMNAPLIAGVTSADAKVLIKDRLFERYGYQYMGGDFYRGAADGRKEEADPDQPVHAS